MIPVESSLRGSKSDLIHEITDSRIFTENRALSVSSFYRCVTSCKKSKKSLELFLRKTMTNHLTNHLTNNTSWSSTDVEPVVSRRYSWLVSYHFFSKTALRIFLIFCLKVPYYKGQKRARRFFRRNSGSLIIHENVPKNGPK